MTKKLLVPLLFILVLSICPLEAHAQSNIYFTPQKTQTKVEIENGLNIRNSISNSVIINYRLMMEKDNRVDKVYKRHHAHVLDVIDIAVALAGLSLAFVSMLGMFHFRQ